MKTSSKEKIRSFWKGWGFSVLVAVLIATSFKSAIADWNFVPSGSMKPTIVEGDRIFVNKLAYDFKVPYTTWHIIKWGNPKRGDVVVFYSPVDKTRLVKRVVGIPGDTIVMRHNRLIINGKALDYKAVEQQTSGNRSPGIYRFNENLSGNEHPIIISPRPYPHSHFGPLTVPENMYFMMGDNRDNSADSRFFGFVERNRIVGKATAIVISLDHARYYRPRWERFFTHLP